MNRACITKAWDVFDICSSLKNQDEQMVFMWDCAHDKRHCSAVTQQIVSAEVFELRAEEQKVRFL